MGMKRKLELRQEFCNIDDYQWVAKGRTQRNIETDEMALIRASRCPCQRCTPFDIDDDIVVLPDFVNRQVNSLVVLHAYDLLTLQELVLKESPSAAFQQLFTTTVLEEGPTLADSLPIAAHILGRSTNGHYTPFSPAHHKMVTLATPKTVAFWAITLGDVI